MDKQEYEKEVEEIISLIQPALEAMKKYNLDSSFMKKHFINIEEEKTKLDEKHNVRRARTAEEYADKFVEYIENISSFAGITIEENQKRILWESYISLVKKYLTIEGLYFVDLDDAYSWNMVTRPAEGRWCGFDNLLEPNKREFAVVDTEDARLVPIIFPLCCRAGYCSTFESLGNPFEEMKKYMRKYLSGVEERLRKGLDQKNLWDRGNSYRNLLETDFSILEKGFYVGAIFGNLRVARGLVIRPSEEVCCNTVVGVQPILNTVRKQLNYLAETEEDATNIRDVLNSVGFFDKNILPNPFKARTINVLLGSRDIDMADDMFDYIKVLDKGVIPVKEKSAFFHFHLEFKDYEDAYRLKDFYNTKAEMGDRSSFFSTDMSKVKVGSGFLFIPSNVNPSKQFSKLNDLISSKKIWLSMNQEIHKKSKCIVTWRFKH